MCKYCEEDKRRKRNLIINTPIVALRIIENNGLNALAIKSYNLEKQVVDSYQIINYCPMCRKEAGRVNCKECKYCKQTGRTKGERYSLGRKEYFCENPEVYTLEDKKGRKIYNFIGYGDTTLESPLQLKSYKRWCPLKREDKQ